MDKKRRNGATKEQHGLYYLRVVKETNLLLLVQYNTNLLLMKSGLIFVWSTHLSFTSKFVSFIVQWFECQYFHCEVCEISKHHSVSFSVSNKLSSILFMFASFQCLWAFSVPNSKAR